MSSQTVQSRDSQRSIEEYAKRIAATHVRDKPDDTQVFVDWTREEVRLVEIADHYPVSDEILPFHFAAEPERGFDYPVVIVLHSREIWEQHEDKTVLLPDGWDFDEFRPLGDLRSD